jgi:uncharacterized protein YjeT (DUF2065 family)
MSDEEDPSLRRIGMGLVIISAFVGALVIYAIWEALP